MKERTRVNGMANSLEQRVGGYNSQRVLADRGFKREGWFPNVTLVAVKIVEKETEIFRFVRVNPTMVYTPDGKTTTIFKPTQQAFKKLKDKDYHMVHLTEGVLDNIPEEGIVAHEEKTPQVPDDQIKKEVDTIVGICERKEHPELFPEYREIHPRNKYQTAMNEIADIVKDVYLGPIIVNENTSRDIDDILEKEERRKEFIDNMGI